MIVTYAGKRFLIDPWLAAKETMPAVTFTPNGDRLNPLVDLPIPLAEIVDVDAVVVTHLHFDHFDDTAKNAIPKNIPMFIQNEEEAETLRSYDFTNVAVLREDGVRYQDVTLTKTGGIHGLGPIVAERYRSKNISGNVCGVVFTHPTEKTLYIAGDTVWCDEVKTAIAQYHPDVITLNAGHAQFLDGIPIIMGKDDVREVCLAAPNAIVVATHMEAVNHAILSRNELREFTREQGFAAQVLIPEDGEVCIL